VPPSVQQLKLVHFRGHLAPLPDGLQHLSIRVSQHLYGLVKVRSDAPARAAPDASHLQQTPSGS
jgi:hypothetical protein